VRTILGFLLVVPSAPPASSNRSHGRSSRFADPQVRPGAYPTHLSQQQVADLETPCCCCLVGSGGFKTLQACIHSAQPQQPLAEILCL
jgi:hypothetical protein